jgi:hypothetical protein
MDFRDIFTPGAPPQKHELLVGREVELNKLRSYLKSPGIHPIVVGARGVGKTSLVQEVINEFELSSQIEANTVKNFNELARHLCDDSAVYDQLISQSVEQHEQSMDAKADVVVASGGLSSKRTFSEYIKGLGDENISPQQLLRLLEGAKSRIIFSIDELDDLPSESDITYNLAKFAKSVSNQSKRINHKFVFSGIGRGAHDLFSGHLSSNRNFPIIYLNPINTVHLREFIKYSTGSLGVNVPSEISDEVITDSNGFPYYVHQIFFHMFEVHEESGDAEIRYEHYIEAKKRAFDSAFSHQLNKYKFTIYRLNDVQKEILQHMVSGRKVHFEYASLEKGILSHHDIGKVKKAFRFLTDNEYISYRKSDKSVSLVEPLLKPFLRSKLKLTGNHVQPGLWDQN